MLYYPPLLLVLAILGEALEVYYDLVVYEEEIVEAAFREGSLEVNELRARVVGARAYRGGGWGIASKQGFDAKPEDLVEKALKLARPGKGRLREAKMWSGSASIGSPPRSSDDVLGIAEALASMGCVEAIVTAVRCRREQWSPVEGWKACEDKCVYEVLVSVREGTAVGSAGLAYAGRLEDLGERDLRRLVERASMRAKAAAHAKPLNPVSRGRWTVILAPEAAAALLHELAHMLEEDASHLPLGTRLTTASLSIKDDPFAAWSPAQRFFDDEGVACTRRELVADGEVVGLLGTRETETPGSARGLFHRPKAMHTSLRASPGDWRFKEMIEETKKGIMVDGVIRCELVDGKLVVMIPEAAWIIEKGEVKEPVKLVRLSLPLLVSLSTIDAVGRELERRHSYEKGHLVAEEAPALRLQAYAE